ncbi:MAG: nucleoside-triphosphatase [Promethearchaeota archaeon]|jgi:nucleoside-triphosphatase THEP1
MPCAIIIHGARGKGKTRETQKLSEIARSKGYKVKGILSIRKDIKKNSIGYDALDLEDNSIMPLAQIRGLTDSDDWEPIDKRKYSFSRKGFEWANQILINAAKNLDNNTLVIIDEFGHIELMGKGLFPGFIKITKALKKGGILCITCRSDKIDAVIDFLKLSSIQIFVHKVGDLEALCRILFSCRD